MAHKPSMVLGGFWDTLHSNQKASVRDQLNTILTDVRSLPCPNGKALGGVVGEGCKVARRQVLRSEKNEKTVAEFEDFLFSSPRPGGLVFVDFLRQLSSHPPSAPKIVFTHG